MDRRWLAAWWLCGVVACNLGKTDIGDLDTDGGSGDSGDSSGGTTSPGSESSPPPAECFEDDDCSDGCCPDFGCNFANECVACTPPGERFDIDGAGCCDDLPASAAEICYAPMCDGELDGCPFEGCATLNGLHAAHVYATDCAQEVCLASRMLALSNEAGTPGLECAGPNGSAECAADPEAIQFYNYLSDELILTMDFDPAILGDYSTEGFNTHFQGAAGQLTIPNATSPLIVFVETGVVSPLVYADGRLQFTITLSLDNPFAKIESDAEDCLSDDIGGECACYYEPLGSYEIAVDLTIEAP